MALQILMFGVSRLSLLDAPNGSRRGSTLRLPQIQLLLLIVTMLILGNITTTWLGGAGDANGLSEVGGESWRDRAPSSPSSSVDLSNSPELAERSGSSVPIHVPLLTPAEALPGGSGSVRFKPFASFELPVTNLPEAQRSFFHAGKALARQPWIKAPTTTDARDGLGPLYNARSCLGCHANGGRGSVPEQSDHPLFSAVLRLSVPGGDALILGSTPDPVYGDQFQTQSIALSHQLRGRIPGRDPKTDPEAPPEAQLFVDWIAKPYVYPDGEARSLRYPKLRIEDLGYGELHTDARTSLRVAPPMHGLGLLEAVDQRSIDALADPHDRDGDGISGRVNRVWDFETQRTVPGRFGWKANRASLRITTAAAFQADVGISNPSFPSQPCTDYQRRCRRAPTGNNADGYELPDELLDLTLGFVKNIGVPKARALDSQSTRGRQYFYQSGCAGCHQPSLTTAALYGKESHLGTQQIWPYTDLLLHDMGSELADQRGDYLATGREWRTPPLWGLGLGKKVNGVTTLLHDGRARNIEEAVLWHGGEGRPSRDAFTALSKPNRDALIAFVRSL
ncbi:MAG: di-heme oxidoredictase family protein [Pseudomonadota bacterium]